MKMYDVYCVTNKLNN